MALAVVVMFFIMKDEGIDEFDEFDDDGGSDMEAAAVVGNKTNEMLPNISNKSDGDVITNNKNNNNRR